MLESMAFASHLIFIVLPSKLSGFIFPNASNFSLTCFFVSFFSPFWWTHENSSTEAKVFLTSDKTKSHWNSQRKMKCFKTKRKKNQMKMESLSNVLREWKFHWNDLLKVIKNSYNRRVTNGRALFNLRLDSFKWGVKRSIINEIVAKNHAKSHT